MTAPLLLLASFAALAACPVPAAPLDDPPDCNSPGYSGCPCTEADPTTEVYCGGGGANQPCSSIKNPLLCTEFKDQRELVRAGCRSTQFATQCAHQEVLCYTTWFCIWNAEEAECRNYGEGSPATAMAKVTVPCACIED